MQDNNLLMQDEYVYSIMYTFQIIMYSCKMIMYTYILDHVCMQDNYVYMFVVVNFDALAQASDIRI